MTTADLNNARVALKMFHTASGQTAVGDILLDDGASLEAPKATLINVSATYTKPFLRTGNIEGTFTVVQQDAEKTEF